MDGRKEEETTEGRKEQANRKERNKQASKEHSKNGRRGVKRQIYGTRKGSQGNRAESHNSPTNFTWIHFNRRLLAFIRDR